MQKSTDGGNSFDEARQQGGREPVIGDADNVQKTSYVVGRGTNPDATGGDAQVRDATGHAPRRGDADAGYTATVPAGGGTNIGLWVVVVLALAIALVYGIGLFT